MAQREDDPPELKAKLEAADYEAALSYVDSLPNKSGYLTKILNTLEDAGNDGAR